ncbi:hypothetical protein AAG604_04120 [Citromicrobium bathyomarinum]
MNDTQTGGREAHRANALALRLEMGLPVSGTGTSAITFGGIESVTWPVLEGIARKAGEDRQDAIFAVYSDETYPTSPAWYFLVYRMLTGIAVMKVHPAHVAINEPLVLVTEDCSRQFAADERGVLREVPVQKKATKAMAHARAAVRVSVTAGTLGDVLDSGAWEATTFAFQSDGTAVPVDIAAA